DPDSACSVLVAGSHTTWLIPTTSRPGPWPSRTRNTVRLFAVETSIGPENGMDRRGCKLKPSSVLMTSRSSQSDGRTLQSGLGRSTRSPVCWAWSSTVKRLLGYGLPAVEEKSKRTLTPPADASPGRKTSTVTAMATRRLAFTGSPFRRRGSGGGGEAVHADPVLGQVHGRGAREVQQAALARAVRDVAGLPLVAGRGHDHDDAAPAPLLDHEAPDVLGAQECPGEVHGNLTGPALERHVEHAQAAEDAGVVDEAVDAAVG